MAEKIANIGECVFGREDDVLIAYGLGSCVACVLYDRDYDFAGLAHIMLPKSDSRKGKEAMFADTGILFLVERLKKHGCNQIVAKIAGGAHVFSRYSDNTIFNIGQKNIDAVEKALSELNIPIQGEDVGGNVGRTIKFFIGSRRLSIHTRTGGKEI